MSQLQKYLDSQLPTPDHSIVQAIAMANHFMFCGKFKNWQPYQFVNTFTTFKTTWRDHMEVSKMWEVVFSPLTDSTTLDGEDITICVDDCGLEIDQFPNHQQVRRQILAETDSLKRRWGCSDWKESSLTIGEALEKASDILNVGPAGFSLEQPPTEVSCQRILQNTYGRVVVVWNVSFERIDSEGDLDIVTVTIVESEEVKNFVWTNSDGGWNTTGDPCDGLGIPLESANESDIAEV